MRIFAPHPRGEQKTCIIKNNNQKPRTSVALNGERKTESTIKAPLFPRSPFDEMTPEKENADLLRLERQKTESTENEVARLRVALREMTRGKTEAERNAANEKLKAERTQGKIASLQKEKAKSDEKAEYEKQRAERANEEIERLRRALRETTYGKTEVKKKVVRKKQKAERASEETAALHRQLEIEQEERAKADEKVVELLSLLEAMKKKMERADEETAKLMDKMETENERLVWRLANERESLEKQKKRLSVKEKQMLEKMEKIPKYQGYRTPKSWSWRGYECAESKFAGLERMPAPFEIENTIKWLLSETMLHNTGCGADGQLGSHFLRKVQSVEVRRIENPILWTSYAQKKEEMIKLIEADGVEVPPLSSRKNGPFPHGIMDASVNEVHLWHGTKRITDTNTRPVEMIAKHGFDERVAKNGLYGDGIYFASQSCKAAQYCHDRCSKEDNWYVMFYCRVLLGHPYATQSDMKNTKRPPARDVTQPGRLVDSVIANQGISTCCGNQVHEEFIVYDRRQVYPEYEVWIKC